MLYDTSILVNSKILSYAAFNKEKIGFQLVAPQFSIDMKFIISFTQSLFFYFKIQYFVFLNLVSLYNQGVISRLVFQQFHICLELV